jgi:hypothetical protein
MVFKKMKNGKVVHSINPIAHILNASKQEQIIEKKTEGMLMKYKKEIEEDNLVKLRLVLVIIN